MAVREGSVVSQVPGERALFSPPLTAKSLPPLVPPSFSSQVATGRTIRELWD